MSVEEIVHADDEDRDEAPTGPRHFLDLKDIDAETCGTF